MQINIHITAGSIKELREQLTEALGIYALPPTHEQAVAMPPPAVAPEEPVAEAPKRTRRTKVEDEKVVPAEPIVPTVAEAVAVAKAFIDGYPQGKERGMAVVKGICATLGFEKVSVMPQDRIPELLDMLGEAK